MLFRSSFPSHKLNYLSSELGFGSKLPHEGFEMWKGCMRDEKKWWEIMRKYNRQDVILLDYGRCVAGGMDNRVLGVVTQQLGIERGGKPVSVSLKPTYDAVGLIRTELYVALPSIYFGRTGYRVTIGD